jgi:hypothetical protein
VLLSCSRVVGILSTANVSSPFQGIDVYADACLSIAEESLSLKEKFIQIDISSVPALKTHHL